MKRNHSQSCSVTVAFCLLLLGGSASANNLTKIGNLIPKNDDVNIIISVWGTSLRIRTDGDECCAYSSTPENFRYFRDKSGIECVYNFVEKHGVKIRYDNISLPMKNACLYKEGLYYEIDKKCLLPLYESKDESKFAVFQGKNLCFDGKKLLTLPSKGSNGQWYTIEDLEVVLGSTFHGSLGISLLGNSTAVIEGWKGQLVNVYVYDHCAFEAKDLDVNSFTAAARVGSHIVVDKLKCSFADLNAADISCLTISECEIGKLSTSDPIEGTITVNGTVLDRVKTPNARVFTKQTTQGKTIEFSKNGFFELSR